MSQNKKIVQPPTWIDRFLRWRLPEEQFEEVQGDMHELYAQWVKDVGQKKANRLYLLNALTFLRPLPKRRKSTYVASRPYSQANPFDMIRNYFTIAFRNLVRHTAFSFINIGGLAVGMTVAMLIGLWVYDELSFNRYHTHYHQIAQVLENQTLEQGIQTYSSLPMPLSHELRTRFASDFKHVAASTWAFEQIIAYQDHKFTQTGRYVEQDFPQMMSIKILKGDPAGLKDPSSLFLSESLAKLLFKGSDPIGKVVKVGNQFTLQVTGIYEDLPHASFLQGLAFIAPLDLLFSNAEQKSNWRSSSFQVFTQLQPNSSAGQISSKIKDVFHEHIKSAAKSELFLHPMHQWHLYSEYKNGENVTGRITFVWMFGIIGMFVLLLACINFMNLSTARSQKRAKEVGIRKAVGSVRRQLIIQFFSESLLIACLAFVVCLLLVPLLLPFFNEVAGKQIAILWTNPVFWLCGIGFTMFTGLLAGSYPALYLSSFHPIKVLKGTFQAGRTAAIPRKVLVVVQFTVSVTLIISTIVVYQQIQFAKNRPIGYSRDGLINIPMNTPDIQGKYDALRTDLLATGAIADMGESSSPITNIFSSANNLEWQGKDPNRAAHFGTISVTPGFGKVVGWQIKEGREFSREFTTDSLAFIFNEAAVKLMGLSNPVGQTIRWHDKNWTVIGVVKDMVMESPFQPVTPTVFMMNNQERPFNVIHIKLNPALPARAALGKIETVLKKYNPASPFEYKFADEEYAKKFAAEERIGTLASVFATLAVFISCLGLSGLASFTAEQRMKEISIRKVLGASLFDLWHLLSKEFVLLVICSLFIAAPIAWYFLSGWLENYEYRTELSPWIFVLAGAVALSITICTVSFQALKAALLNPVRSLRNE